MEAFVTYLLEANLLLAGLSGIYWLLLRGLTFYTWNRFYLLFSILLSFSLPLLDTGWLSQADEVTSIYLGSVGGMLDSSRLIGEVQAASPETDLYTLLQYLLLSGTGIMLLLLLGKFEALYRVISSGQSYRNTRHAIIVETATDIPPFSFWNYILLNPAKYSSAERHKILAHESIHVKQYHSADILLSEISALFCWFNPMFWLHARALRQNLEYLTDRSVLHQGYDPQDYQLCLLKISMKNSSRLPVAYFTASAFKLRLFRMNRLHDSTNIQTLRYLAAVPVLTWLLLAANTPLAANAPLKSALKGANFFKKPGQDDPATRKDLYATAAETRRGDDPAYQQESQAIPGKAAAALVPQLPANTSPTDNMAGNETPSTPATKAHNWSATGQDLGVTIRGNHVTVTGKEGYAILKNANGYYPDEIVLPDYPDAIVMYNGREYPLHNFREYIDPKQVYNTQVYTGKYATERFGEAGNRGVVTFNSVQTETIN